MPQPIQVRYFKHPNHPHMEFPARIIEETEDYLLTYFAKGTVGTHHTRGLTWTQGAGSLQFWYRGGRYYSIHCALDEACRLNYAYCNVNTPFALEDGTLRCVDLDLDVKVYADLSWEVVDQDEFAEHQLRYGYPPHLITAAEAAVAEIIDRVRTRSHPFGLAPDQFRALLAKAGIQA